MVKIWKRPPLGSEIKGSLGNLEEKAKGNDTTSWAEGSPWMQAYLKGEGSGDAAAYGEGMQAADNGRLGGRDGGYGNDGSDGNNGGFVKTDEPDGGAMDWIKTIYGDPEEEAKRERRNKQILGIAAVGDAVRQLGNIYHTTKYAPSQTLTGGAEKAAEKMEKDRLLLQAQREKTAELLQRQRKQQAEDEYRRAQLAYKDQELALKRGESEKRGEYYDARTADAKKATEMRERDMTRREADSAHRRKMAQGNLAVRQQQVRNQRAHQMEMERQGRERNAIARERVKQAKERAKNGGDGKVDGTNIVYDKKGRGFDVPKGKLNKGQVDNLYDELRRQGKVDGMATNTNEKMQDVLANAENKKVKDALDRMGVSMVDDGSGSVDGGKPWWVRTREAVEEGARDMMEEWDEWEIDTVDDDEDLEGIFD